MKGKQVPESSSSVTDSLRAGNRVVAFGIAAIVANGVSIRRFHRSNHKWKRHMTVVNVGIIGLLLVLIIIDAAELLG